MGTTLLLTATISPPAGAPQLKRVDPRQRLGDYCWAMDFYCRISPAVLDRIVFVENSGHDLSAIRAVVDKAGAGGRVEMVSFNGLDHPPGYGRGYGEFKLLDHAIDHSSTVAAAGPDERYWKATGRYRVVNLPTMIRTAPANYGLYCDVRDRPMPWLDLRVFSCTLAGYRRHLAGLYHQLKESELHMAPEKYLRPKVAEWAAADPGVVTRFRREPYVSGIRGLDAQSYRNGVNLLKYWVRAGTRALGH